MASRKAPGSRALVVGLQLSAGAVLVAALVAAALPGEAGRWAGAAMVGLLVAVPVVRVGLLTWLWGQQGDGRFARYGVALLLVLAIAPVVAVVSA